MHHSSARPADAIERIIDTHGNSLYRLCLVMLRDPSDAEDAVQETILKYLQKAPDFRDAEHEKAWLLRVAANHCRDVLRSRVRHPQTALEEVREAAPAPADSGILEALMTLPQKYRIVLTLYYVEEYPIHAIAKMIGRTPSAVKMRLQKGRKLLEEAYRREYL